MSTNTFEQEREVARIEAITLTAALTELGYEVGEIDWQNAGRLAFVFVNKVPTESILTLHGYHERGQLSTHVRYALLENVARQQLQETTSVTSWTPLDLPDNASEDMQSLWRIHFDEEKTGVNVAEYLRDGKRVYAYYAGGPTPGGMAFYVDTISPTAVVAIRERGGSIVYTPHAQRADGVQGRRYVTMPECSTQYGPDAIMAPQTLRFPDGVELRLIPDDVTVALYLVEEVLL